MKRDWHNGQSKDAMSQPCPNSFLYLFTVMGKNILYDLHPLRQDRLLSYARVYYYAYKAAATVAVNSGVSTLGFKTWLSLC